MIVTIADHTTDVDSRHFKYNFPECSYKYLNKTCLVPIPFHKDDDTVTEQAQCDEMCKSSIRCTASIFFDGVYCFLYEAPVIFASYEIDLNQCIEKCKERSDCITMSSPTVSKNKCFLLNVTLAEISVWTFENNRCTIVEKIC
ncbi:hypothetical protein LOTGIDRAFT_167851 [Lottia gigantea]|uniref:Apple domain-containing protein n=1 Tax=Lottia gigantea TaxID=225164 RepID=V4B8W7_LOTGI|nr:hypothetical protein LOTGIDRAFT_167851 [Lottia gigantea]ESO85279.1 hypothetical protein LOTGIDRAFT_167851 [Lottia gigantea]